MLFNSYIFILFFLPVTLLLYFGLNKFGKETEAKCILIGMSLWFYAFFHVYYLLLIVASMLLNFFCARNILKVQYSEGVRRTWLVVGIAIDIGVIIYFKYLNFFLENANAVFGTQWSAGEILMPLGISFFTFQQISYLVDSYRMETKEYRFVDYILFVSFFPQLVAGPIVLHNEMIPQFQDSTKKKLSQEMLAQGIYLFAIGLFKKVMIADVLGRGVDWGFANTEILTAIDVILISLLYTLQIYFDFSGYCDMACGIANMFRIELPINFNSPYKATSILEFWQRWHMTLTRFLRKYIYFPLGGSRQGTARTILNVMIVFLVSGIWHGAAWTFIIWGVLHGVANVLCRLFQNIWMKIPKLIRWFMTFIFVDLMWILFRAESLKEAGIMFGKLMQPWEMKVSVALMNEFDILEFTYIEDHISFFGNLATRYPMLHMCICLAVALLAALGLKNCHERKFHAGIGSAVTSIILLVWSIVSLSGLSSFLYFNF